MSILCKKDNNEFDYLLFDGSYILTRRAMAMNHYELSSISISTLLSETIGMILKFINDYATPEKVFIIWDKWDNEIKGYYRTRDLSDYKGNRYYHNEDDLQNLKDSGASEDEIKEYEKKLKINQVKQQTKKYIIDHLCDYGMPSIMFPGYEADDIAKAFCDIYKKDCKVGIVSKDSDWKFLTGDKSIYIDLLTGEQYPENRVRSEEHINENIPIYTFKCLLDSMYGSHNNLQVTVNKKLVNYKIKKYDAVTRTFSGDNSLILPDKLELFKTNIESFRIKNFPKYSELESTIKDSVENKGSIASIDEFDKLRRELNLSIRTNDYESFIDNLNTNKYGAKIQAE